MTREELVTSEEYWTESLQNQLYSHVVEYMKNESVTQNELAEKFGVSKGRISQILKGNIDFRISTIIKMILTIGKIPKFTFLDKKEFLEEDSNAFSIEETEVEWNVSLQDESYPFKFSIQVEYGLDPIIIEVPAMAQHNNLLAV